MLPKQSKPSDVHVVATDLKKIRSVVWPNHADGFEPGFKTLFTHPNYNVFTSAAGGKKKKIENVFHVHKFSGS